AVTRTLPAIEQDEPPAAAQLLSLAYHELRQLAAQVADSGEVRADGLAHGLGRRALASTHFGLRLDPPGRRRWPFARRFSLRREQSLRLSPVASAMPLIPYARAPGSGPFFLSRLAPDCGVSL